MPRLRSWEPTGLKNNGGPQHERTPHLPRPEPEARLGQGHAVARAAQGPPYLHRAESGQGMITPSVRGPITLGEAVRREQSKALARMKPRDVIPLARAFGEPCFKCGTAGECRHRKNT